MSPTVDLGFVDLLSATFAMGAHFVKGSHFLNRVQLLLLSSTFALGSHYYSRVLLFKSAFHFYEKVLQFNFKPHFSEYWSSFSYHIWQLVLVFKSFQNCRSMISIKKLKRLLTLSRLGGDQNDPQPHFLKNYSHTAFAKWLKLCDL